MHVIAFGSILLILFAVGCAADQDKSTKRSPTVTIPTNWILYEKQKEGFEIALPPSWRQIIMDPITRETAIKTAKEKFPQMATLAEDIGTDRLLSESGFYAIEAAPDATLGDGSSAKINIIKVPLETSIPLDVLVQANIREMEKIPEIEKPILTRRVNLTAGEAVEIRHRMRINFSGQTMTESSTLYAFIRGENVYLITLGTGDKNAEKYALTFDRIANSFRFTK